MFESKQNIDKEMIEKVCKIWYNTSIQNDKTLKDVHARIIQIGNQTIND